MFSEDDPARLLASSAERAALSGTDLAKVLGAFRAELLSQGFPHTEVGDLCMEFFQAMLEPPPQDDDE